MNTSHFNGKDALSHVAEKLAEGTLISKEIHGLEVPGNLHAFADAARDMAVSLLLLVTLLGFVQPSTPLTLKLLGLYALGFTIWKTGRSAWLGWGRLERLHRLLAQEKWEIENHRPQEREELIVLYTAKGFEGKLLEDVVDVLMADESRLLKVMIEEEMGIQLENLEHPLKQGFGAFLGALFTALMCLVAFYITPNLGIPFAALSIVGAAASFVAYTSGNKMINAFVWSISIAAFSWALVYFGLGAL